MIGGNSPTQPHGWRRFFRYSLRTALATMVAVALILGWFQSRLRYARQREEAVAALRESGVWPVYDYEYTADIPQDARSTPPTWLVEWCGVDPFVDVVLVDLSGHQVDGAMLSHLSAFSNLEELQLFRTTVRDEHLAGIAAIDGLRVLDVSSDEITDGGLVHLAGMASLSELYVGGKNLTDRAIDDLRRSLPNTIVTRYGKTPDQPWKMPGDDGTGYEPLPWGLGE